MRVATVAGLGLFLGATAIDTSKCACPWLASALNRGLVSVLPDGTIPQSASVEAARKAGFECAFQHVVVAPGINRHVDAITCGSSEWTNYHMPPSGIRPHNGPPNATRFDEIMAGIGLGPGDTFDRDKLLEFGEYVFEHPTERIRQQIEREVELRVLGYPIEVSLSVLLNNVSPRDGPIGITYEELRRLYVDGEFPDRQLRESGCNPSGDTLGYVTLLRFFTVTWYDRMRALIPNPRTEYVSNILSLANDALQGVVRDALGALRR